MAFDDIRVLLPNMDNGQLIPYTHAYGHYSLNLEVHVDQGIQHTDAGTELQIEEHSAYMKLREQKHEARLYVSDAKIGLLLKKDAYFNLMNQ